MKKFLIFALFLAAALCIGCSQKKPPPEPIEEDGGVTNNNSYDAPKVIESTFITSFQCDFSAMPLLEEDTYLSGRNYQLEAVFKDGAVKGYYRSYDRYGERTDIKFAASHYFLKDLQEIVAKHDLAQYNGLDISVSGLPEMYGAYLQIDYASQERIYASDNQSCFLPLAAMEELEAFFHQQLPTVPASDDGMEE